MSESFEERVPVLIVGGGPSGLLLSTLLSRFGVDSLLVERNPGTTDHPQAHVVNSRTMEIFRLIGIAASVNAEALPQPAASVIRWVTSIAGDEFASLNIAPAPADVLALMAATPTAPVSCAQDRIEPLLARLAEKGPGKVTFSTRLIELEQDDAGVTATLDANGTERVIRAHWVVGCDGASSTTRRLVGIPMEGPDALAKVVGIYFHADLAEIAAGRPALLNWTIDTETPGVFIAMDGRQRWVFHAFWDSDQASIESYTDEHCQAILRRAVGADLDFDIRSVRPWVMTAQVANRYREGRVLLAGDAAHRFPPTGGFGMNTGVQDAHNLAWKLAAVIDGSAGASLIDTYEYERRPVGQGNCDWSVRNALGLAEIMGPGAAHQASRLASGEVSFESLSIEIQTIADREVAHFSALGRELGFEYGEDGALVGDGSDPVAPEDPDRDYVPNARPGARAPHFGLVREGQLLSSLDLFDGRWTLLATGARGTEWKAAAAAQPIPIEAVILGVDTEDPGSVFTMLYDVGDGAVLVRPDGHVAFRAKDLPADAEGALRTALVSILRRSA